MNEKKEKKRNRGIEKAYQNRRTSSPLIIIKIQVKDCKKDWHLCFISELMFLITGTLTFFTWKILVPTKVQDFACLVSHGKTKNKKINNVEDVVKYIVSFLRCSIHFLLVVSNTIGNVNANNFLEKSNFCTLKFQWKIQCFWVKCPCLADIYFTLTLVIENYINIGIFIHELD